MSDLVKVRRAEQKDLGALGGLAGKLVRFHHALDARRFLLVDDVENGYARFLGSLLQDPHTVLLLAERSGSAIGYAYARLEPRDWNALLEACGALHDIFVAEGERRSGVATALLEETVARLRALGAPRIVLHTAVANEAARRFFESHGFRPTMIEMTRELY